MRPDELEMNSEMTRKCKAELSSSTQDIESAIELLKLYSISQERNASDALRAAEAARDAAEKDAADLREKLKALANDLAAAEADHDRKQHDLQAEIEALKAELEAVKNRDKERNDSDARSNAMLQEALDVANERLKNAKDDIADKQKELNALQAKLDLAKEHGYESGDETDPNQLRRDLDQARDRIAELEREIERLKKRIEELEAQIRDLEARIAELEAENRRIAAKNAELERKNAELQRLLDEANSRPPPKPATPPPVPKAAPPPDPEISFTEREATAWDQYLYSRSAEMDPVRVDIARWLNTILKRKDIEPDDLLRRLALGEILCELALAIDEGEAAYRESETGKAADKAAVRRAKKEAKAAAAAGGKGKLKKQRTSRSVLEAQKKGKVMTKEYVPQDATLTLQMVAMKRGLAPVVFTRDVQNGSPAAIANVEAFLAWSEGLGATDPRLFAIDDLCQYTDERRVLFGLYDVARRTRHCPLPWHVTFERARYRLHPEVFADHLHERVWEIAEAQVCGLEFIRPEASEGKYTVRDWTSDESHTIKLREVGKNITVRTGGGYFTLKEWIAVHDPWANDPIMAAAVKTYIANQDKFHEDVANKVKVDENHPGIMTTRPVELWLIK